MRGAAVLVLVGLAPPCLSAWLFRPPLVLHAQLSPVGRAPPKVAMNSEADSSLVSPAAVAVALKAEEAQRTRLETEKTLPRAERRARASATRDLAQSFITVGVEPRKVCTHASHLPGASPFKAACLTTQLSHASVQAVKYSECLVDRGLRSIEGLDADMMAACGTPS